MFLSHPADKDLKRLCAKCSNKFRFFYENLDESPVQFMSPFSTVVLSYENLANIIFSYLLNSFHTKSNCIFSISTHILRFIALLSSGNYNRMVLLYRFSSSETPFVRLAEICCVSNYYFSISLDFRGA